MARLVSGLQVAQLRFFLSALGARALLREALSMVIESSRLRLSTASESFCAIACVVPSHSSAMMQICDNLKFTFLIFVLV